MEFYHTETNRDIHHHKADAISHGKKNKKFRIVDIAMPGDTRNVESRERERERDRNKGTQGEGNKKQGFPGAKKRGASHCENSGRDIREKKALELNKCLDFMNAYHIEDGF